MRHCNKCGQPIRLRTVGKNQRNENVRRWCRADDAGSPASVNGTKAAPIDCPKGGYHQAPIQGTSLQLRLLAALQAAYLDAKRVRSGSLYFTPGDLVKLHLVEKDSSWAGLHQTAASLVRKGLVEKRMIWSTTHYAITNKGRELLGSVSPTRLLPCGCPIGEVRDLGHQEGCGVRAA
jgi:hypothetical protein